MNYAELARQQNISTSAILEESLRDKDCILALTKSYCFVNDISLCVSLVSGRRESKLILHSIKEYQFALFALNQGFYRHAFSALRLSFELALSAIEFSANEIALRQWEQGSYDVSWGRIVNPDAGIFSNNFLKSFSAGVDDKGQHFRSLAEKVYRECSEYVHGNASTHCDLPVDINFSKNCVIDWCEKAAVIHMVVLFSFFSRYLNDMTESERRKVESPFLENLGYIKSVRVIFGAAI